MSNDLLEKLAELEHEQWASWTKYFLSNLNEKNIIKWKKQLNTKYAELSDMEKESDRKWAKRVMDLIK